MSHKGVCHYSVMLKPLRAAAALLAGAVVTAALTAPAHAAPPPPDERGASAEARQRHQETIEFWTVERVRQAVPRDFVLDPVTGRGQGPEDRARGGKGAPGGGGDSGDGGGTTTAVTGASWESGGVPAEATGKVLFRMDGSYYVCSATALEDGVKGTTVVTAAHCVYDNDAGAKTFADMWMFVPNYDAAPEPLDAAGRFCDSTVYGCWTPEALLVPDGFADSDGFQYSALPYDFAFASLGFGGTSGNAELEKKITGLPAPLFVSQDGARSWRHSVTRPPRSTPAATWSTARARSALTGAPPAQPTGSNAT